MQLIKKEDLINFRIIKEDLHNYYVKGKTGPSKITKIPKQLDEDICCYAGILIGDGHLVKKKKRIKIELIDLKLIKKIATLTQNLFNLTPQIYKIKDKRRNRKLRYNLQIDNSSIHSLFKNQFNIPSGKKSNIVSIPKIIKKENKNYKIAFIIGLFATDGGRRHNKIGISTASEQLRDDTSQILNELNIKHSRDIWIYKKYKKEYYGLYFARKELNSILRECRSGQTGQILDSFLEKIGG